MAIYSDSQGVVEAWMSSPTHRDNILKSSYQDVGFAIVNGILNGEETTLVVQMFGSRTKPIVQLQAVPPVVTTVPAQRTEVAQLAPVAVFGQYRGVSIRPKVDITKLNQTVVMSFVGLILVVLAVDAWLVARRRIVRASGHNIAHILFFIALFLLVGAVRRGSLL